MQTGFVLFYFLFPTLTKGCCETQRIIPDVKSVSAEQQFHHYKVVEGEVFLMPCDPSVKSPIKWFKADQSKECGKEFVAEVEDAGAYKSLTGLNFTLKIIKKTSLRCFQPSAISMMLLVNKAGTILCPGHACYNNTGVVWYKKNKPVSKQFRRSCEKRGQLTLCTVHKEDTGVYYCDREITEQGLTWIFRRAVNVTVISKIKANSTPVIMYPAPNMTEEVQLGQPHNLTCEVIFDFEVNTSRKVQWFMDYGRNMKKMPLLPPVEQNLFDRVNVTQISIIKEVMPQHLKHTYTCFASYAAGNQSITIKLKQKKQAKLLLLVGSPFACFLLVAGLGITLHLKWVDLQLFCRSHFQFGKYEGEKEFDVFVSFVRTNPSAELVNGLSLSSKAYSDAEGCKSKIEMQSSQVPIEILLPQVLEEQWGYHVCLLERDILPGGAYTNDVVLTINRSRMLICILSAEYFNSSDAVFVLESGVKALLQRSALKMLLIWTDKTSASYSKPEPPLPKLVQRALKVLPSLQWSTATSSTNIRSFWVSLRKAMPADRERLATLQCSQYD